MEFSPVEILTSTHTQRDVQGTATIIDSKRFKLDTTLLLTEQDQRRPKKWILQGFQQLSSPCTIASIPRCSYILNEPSFDANARSCLSSQLLWRRVLNTKFQSAANIIGEIIFSKHSKTSTISSMRVDIIYTLGNEGRDACSVTLMVSR